MRYAIRSMVAACVSVALATALFLPVSTAQAARAEARSPAAGLLAHTAASPPPNQLNHPGSQLPAGWRASPDRELSVAGDATGLHVLVADEASGYAWRTAATLTVPGVDTSEWIGQACLTASGTRAVVVYAPRQITNLADAQGTTALAAVVDLGTGKVTSLGGGFSIAYFDPGCGTGEDAVLTQGGWGGAGQAGLTGRTRLVMIDARTGKTVFTVTEPGQVTSAVPSGGQIAATYGPGLVTIGAGGRVRTLARLNGEAFRLVPDAAGLGFQVMAGQQVQVRQYAQGRNRLIGVAAAGSVGLEGAGGHVWLTGPHASRLGPLPDGWHATDVPVLSQVSTTGTLAVTSVQSARQTAPPGAQAAPDQPQPVQIGAQIIATGQHVAFTVPAAPPGGSGQLPSPGQPGTARHPAVKAAAAVNPATVTYDPDRTCSVARNDPSIQAYQPSAQQVEWAADQAVQGTLTGTRGPALYGSSLPAYTPQGMFPAPGLSGGGSVPAQVLLGVLTQESNLEQASDHVIIGLTGNFLPSYNWYGNWDNSTSPPIDTGQVGWSNVDCGYGIAQITAGMCMAGNAKCPSVDGSALPATDQLAVAVDYQANIAAGLQDLENKWNQLSTLGITANAGASQYIENWWFALWDYNSGLEPNAQNGNSTGCSPSPSCADSGGDWGLGWANNPANMEYPPDRDEFLDGSSSTTPDGGTYSPSWDEAHPQYWSYEEKVIGFAFNSFTAYSFVDGKYEQAYAYGQWSSSAVDPAEPPHTALCTSQDHCNPGAINTGSPNQATDPCQQPTSLQDHCWWHWPLGWATCAARCGTQVLTYAAGAAAPGYPGVPAGYAPNCSSSPLPSSAVIVGDVPSSIPAPLGCGTSWANNGGTMTWSFASSNGTYPSKIDFHQVGGGYSGHFWFTHTIYSDQSSVTSTTPDSSDKDLLVTGTWNPPSSVTGWTRIMVAIPNEGAWDPEATYLIKPGSGQAVRRVVVNQAYQSDTWADLGLFQLSAGASVSLTNVTYRGLGYDTAWDAAAFIPAAASGADYVAMGDSYSAGQGVQPFDANSDYSYEGMADACHRSTSGAYSRMVTLPGSSTPIAQQAASLTGGTQYHFTACSGAVTTQLSLAALDSTPTAADTAGSTDWGTPQDLYGESPQDDTGWLGPQTTLVTLTIGGNDARFADVLTGCLLPGVTQDCNNAGYILTRHSNGAVDPGPLAQFEPQVIGLEKNHLVDVYQEIGALAPHAEIIVLGYPRLFPESTSSACNVGLDMNLSAADQNWLNQEGDLLNQNISAAVSKVAALGVNIHYVNPVPGFTGHAICSAAPWLNGLINWSVSGSGLQVVGGGSFHPMLAGQQEYAKLVDGCLAGTVAC
jgi:GDSL-like Lipase/Acylhydrolase family